MGFCVSVALRPIGPPPQHLGGNGVGVGGVWGVFGGRGSGGMVGLQMLFFITGTVRGKEKQKEHQIEEY